MSTDSNTEACATRLGDCPTCGYPLEGLPDEGVCPECGRAYDQQMFVVHGWVRGLRSTAQNSRSIGGFLMGTLPYAPQLLLGLLSFFWGQPTLGMTCIMLFVAPVGLVGLARVRPSAIDQPPPVQLRMNAAGCLLCDTPGARSRLGWIAHHVDLLSVPIVFAVFGLTLGWNLLSLWLLIPATLIPLIGLWVIRGFVKRQMAKQANPLLRRLQADAYFGVFPITAAPWNRIRAVSILPERDGRQRIRMTPGDRGGIDMETEMNDAQAATLRSRIFAWRESAVGAMD